MSVLFYASLPLEVKQILGYVYNENGFNFRVILMISDFKVDPYSGEIDTVTGFALVTSVQTCFVCGKRVNVHLFYIDAFCKALKGVIFLLVLKTLHHDHLFMRWFFMRAGFDPRLRGWQNSILGKHWNWTGGRR